MNINVSLAKWNAATTLRSVSTVFLLLIPLQAGLSWGKATPQFIISKKGFHHTWRISLILLHTFAKWLMAISFSTSLSSREAFCICIQLFAVIVWHPDNIVLCPLPPLWLSLFGNFVPYMNPAFSMHTDLAMSLRGTRTRARTYKCDMTAEDAFSRLWDEFKHLVDEADHLDDAKHIVS